MKNKKKVLTNTGWLLMGLGMVFFSGGDQPVWIALWLAPLFILRFFRETGVMKAFLIVLIGKVAVDLIADKGMTPFPSFKILLFYTVIGVAIGLVPYVVDRVFRHRLPVWLRTFLFPSLAAAIPFFLGSYGSWGEKANGLNDLALLQLVSVTGVSGISFLINWLAAVANEIWEQRQNRTLVKKLSVSFISVMILVYGFGLIRLHSDYHPKKTMLAAGMVQDPSMRGELISAFTRLVKSNPKNPAETNDIRLSMNRMFEKLLDDSMKMAESDFKLAVWSEGAVLLHDEDESRMIQLAVDKAREKNMYLGVSVGVYQGQKRNDKKGIQKLFKNKLILISPGGTIEWEYAKGIPVPGMEAAITIPGDRVMKTSTSFPKITGAICYELDFPGHIRQAARLNASLLLGPSNDWAAIKNTHARMARLRAIETGVPLLRPANGGVSIAVDPYGRLLSQVDHTRYEKNRLTTVIPLTPVSTIYAKIGDTFDWLCSMLLIICLTAGAVKGFKGKGRHLKRTSE